MGLRRRDHGSAARRKYPQDPSWGGVGNWGGAITGYNLTGYPKPSASRLIGTQCLRQLPADSGYYLAVFVSAIGFTVGPAATMALEWWPVGLG